MIAVLKVLVCSSAHYQDPYITNCLPGEVNESVPGIVGRFCSPLCQGAAQICPSDKPEGILADAQCVLSNSSDNSAGDKRCALICSQPNQCGRARCQQWQAGVGICVYDEKPSPPPFGPQHDYMQDRHALDLLFNTTQNFKKSLFWLETLNWKNKSASMCHRYGVTCTEPDSTGKRRVETISLSGNQLMNSIPTGFFPDLPKLHTFACANNQLTGTLPEDLSQASSLTGFEGYNNALHGSIDVFGKLLHFNGRLDLHYNNFSGTLPPTLGSLHELTYLSVANNRLHGTIPPTWAELTSLTILGLASNELSGTVPTFIGSALTKLIVLFLRDNQFTGAVPSLAKLQRLSVLDLDHNGFTSLPTDLCELPKGVFSTNNCGSDWGGSQECCVSANPFECVSVMPTCAYSCQAAVCNCEDHDERCMLAEFYVAMGGDHWHNRSGWFAHAAEADLCEWHGVECDPTIAIDIDYTTHTNFSEDGSTRNEISIKSNTSRRVTGLNLASNNLIGHVPESLGNLSSLRSLVLSHNHLLSMPATLRHLQDLRVLELQNASLAIAFPRLDNFSKLQVLELGQNSISGSVPVDMVAKLAASQAPLEKLDLAGNQLTGTVPEKLCAFPLGLGCKLAHNKFTSPLPNACLVKCEV